MFKPNFTARLVPDFMASGSRSITCYSRSPYGSRCFHPSSQSFYTVEGLLESFNRTESNSYPTEGFGFTAQHIPTPSTAYQVFQPDQQRALQQSSYPVSMCLFLPRQMWRGEFPTLPTPASQVNDWRLRMRPVVYRCVTNLSVSQSVSDGIPARLSCQMHLTTSWG